MQQYFDIPKPQNSDAAKITRFAVSTNKAVLWWCWFNERMDIQLVAVLKGSALATQKGRLTEQMAQTVVIVVVLIFAISCIIVDCWVLFKLMFSIDNAIVTNNPRVMKGCNATNLIKEFLDKGFAQQQQSSYTMAQTNDEQEVEYRM